MKFNQQGSVYTDAVHILTKYQSLPAEEWSIVMFIGSFFLFLTTKLLVLLIVVTLWTVLSALQ